MKKQLVLGALAALALVACSKTEVVELNKGNEISLTAVTGKNLTKAADGYCNKSMPANFVVWASTESKLYFSEKTYSLGTGSTYTSDPASYWPATPVNFFALKNQNGTVNFDYATPKITVTGYTVENTPETQKDFLYAVSLGQEKATGATLNFRHALAQIEFKAKNSNPNIHVVIDGIQVVNVNSKGNFAASVATANNYKITSDPHANGETPISDPRLGRCSWDTPSDLATYTIKTKNASGVEASIDIPKGSSENLTVTDPSGKEYNVNTLYLLPQSVDAWDGTGAAQSSGQAYFVVNAIIYNVAGASVNKNTDVVLWGTKTGSDYVTKPIAVPFPSSTNWEDGLRYVYTFNFTTTGTGGSDPGTGADVLTPITLSVTVDDFVDVADKEIEVK